MMMVYIYTAMGVAAAAGIVWALFELKKQSHEVY